MCVARGRDEARREPPGGSVLLKLLEKENERSALLSDQACALKSSDSMHSSPSTSGARASSLSSTPSSSTSSSSTSAYSSSSPLSVSLPRLSPPSSPSATAPPPSPSSSPSTSFSPLSVSLPRSVPDRVTGSFYAASVLFVAPSLIPGTGQGLFTSQRLPKDSWLCEYLGTRLSLRQILREQNRAYVICAGTLNAHIDARLHPEVLARYINDNAKKEKLNARFVKDKERRRVFVQALRDLEAGEEIYASYGEGYWRNRPFFASGDGSKQLLPGEALEEEDEERKGRSFESSKEEKPEREGALGGRETQREEGEEK
uniref:SET domain-containing protein n=2 Tax=Toxoplasma gondii TaxID=5811 RepID=A0A0F7UYG3_TOXGV|nr:TPA: SET domain-containing protein [Toxoplasma gondii VEG]